MDDQPTIAERLNTAGVTAFIATVVLSMTTDGRSLIGLAVAGGLVAAAGVLVLCDFRGSAEPSAHGHSIPGFPRLERYVGGGFLVLFGVCLIVLGVLAAFGVIEQDPDLAHSALSGSRAG